MKLSGELKSTYSKNIHEFIHTRTLSRFMQKQKEYEFLLRKRFPSKNFRIIERGSFSLTGICPQSSSQVLLSLCKQKVMLPRNLQVGSQGTLIFLMEVTFSATLKFSRKSTPMKSCHPTPLVLHHRHKIPQYEE